MAARKEGIDQNLIRELAQLLNESDLTEIEIEQNGVRVRVQRTATALAQEPSPASPRPAEPRRPAADHEPPAQHPGAVTSPMVGTCFRSPEPGQPPFVEVGTRVAEGQTLLIVEAMKTFNPITAPRNGTVAAILVEDGQPVEFGEPLLIIE
jgi:acetyl-CoA carboxylase biotin carboxyl carrier protein